LAIRGAPSTVVLEIAAGRSNAEIAAALQLEESTVKGHVRRMLAKFDLASRVQAVIFAYETIHAAPHANICSHMTSNGSVYARLQRAIRARNLAIIHATAAELGYVPMRDALGILLVIEAKDDERFEPAAVRWAGRLALETPDLALAELAGALESLHALPDEHAQRSLLALAERARPAARRARRPGP
jgi:hypothetical protein